MSLAIIPIPIPNPYFEGDSNAYVISTGDGPLILVDTGIGTREAFEHFRHQLTSHGLRLENISAILLTHKHPDHFGLARTIQKQSGAAVYVHEDDWVDVVCYDERRDAVADLYRQTMHFWGIPSAGIELYATMRHTFDALAQSVPAEKLRDGQRLNVGHVEFTVVHTPGHTQGSACIVTGNKIFTGDHLLPHYTPNVGATDITVGQMLKKFLSSLEKIRPYAAFEALPGHHHAMCQFESRLDLIMAHHKEREAKILRILADHRPRTIFTIAKALFGTMREHHLLLGCGEVHAHLELLQEVGLAKLHDENSFVLC
jgi:hydroxyacylglutathione hydrolase